MPPYPPRFSAFSSSTSTSRPGRRWRPRRPRSANVGRPQVVGRGVDPVSGPGDRRHHRRRPLDLRPGRLVARRPARAEPPPGPGRAGPAAAWSCSRRSGRPRAVRPRRWPAGPARPRRRPGVGQRHRHLARAGERPDRRGRGPAQHSVPGRRCRPPAPDPGRRPRSPGPMTVPSVASLVTSPGAPVAPSRASVSRQPAVERDRDALGAGRQQRRRPSVAVRAVHAEDDGVDGELGGIGVGKGERWSRGGSIALASLVRGSCSRDASRPVSRGACPEQTVGFPCYDRLPLRRSPLHDRHVALGAKFAAFGGWEMPLEYAGGGVLREHAAVREAVGVFDVSHLGKATVRGPGAADVRQLLPHQRPGPDRLGPGAVHAVLRRPTGGVVDDLIAYLHADDHVFLIPNAANTAEVVAPPAGGRAARRDRHRRARGVRGAGRAGAALGRVAGRARAADRARLHVASRRRRTRASR